MASAVSIYGQHREYIWSTRQEDMNIKEPFFSIPRRRKASWTLYFNKESKRATVFGSEGLDIFTSTIFPSGSIRIKRGIKEI